MSNPGRKKTLSNNLSHLTDIKSTTAKIAKILKKSSTKKTLKNPVVPTSHREQQAHNNKLRALTDTTILKKQIAEKIAKIEKESQKKIDDLERRRRDLSPLQKKLDDFERRLKKLTPLRKQTKKRSSSSKTKKLSPRTMSSLQKNLDLEDKFSILKGGRFRKTNKRYKRYKR